MTRSRAQGFITILVTLACSALAGTAPAAAQEVRGTWVTTTANTHIASPERTAETMSRFRAMGLNTVYVETWKNGYTQFPSETLERVIGVDRRPDLVKQDPGDPDRAVPARDLLHETLTEAHRNGLTYIAWFEYGFMAAHKDTDNHLRRMKPEWLSRDIDGGVVAPNGFVWMNPLHPEARRFLLDIVLEAIDKYDLDGVQLDDRIVWPYYTMGYDDFTVAMYRNEHGGAAPPSDPKDAGWMRWRADKVNEYSRQFVEEVRRARPGILVSLSPAPYPWCFENYLLEWPTWATWLEGNDAMQWWDEFIPQCYRYDFPAFRATWDQQIDNLVSAGAEGRVDDMLAGILTTGSKPDPVPWSDLQQAVEHVRETGGGGHVWWYSRGVLDEYPDEVAAFYADSGEANDPRFPAHWRSGSVPCDLDRYASSVFDGGLVYRATEMVERADYRAIVKRAGVWRTEEVVPADRFSRDREYVTAIIPNTEGGEIEAVELIRDRRPDMASTITRD